MSALYQRARPLRFEEVVGQEHVKDVLTLAVARGLTGHAYLFSGPRGVGKTTTARLMAMAVNCEREDPSERPCGECESCRLVQGGSHPDVIELDAASNNSVDDVRALRERVGLASLRGGRRVWVLDEAHMLSRAAANALLKTLEEPPPGLMFVLATTEPEKLPPTILSRCQHFRFRRLTDAEIQGKLERLCREAGVEAEAEALALVARAAEGAMRDAESLLERLLVGGGPVTADEAEDALGLPPRDRLRALADALLAGDLARLLPQAGDLYRAGFAPRTVAEQLGRTLRDGLHESLAAGDADETRLVALIHALDDEQERFVRRDDLYGLEVALIKAVRAGAGSTTSEPAASEPATAVPSAPVRTAAAPVTGAETAAVEPRPSDPEPPPPARARAERAAPEASPSPPPAPAAASKGRQFSWHAVRSAAAPQLKAFLQPAQVEESGGRVTLVYGESWRFHFDQVVARREELEELVASVAGPGFVLDLQGPRGSAAGTRRRTGPMPAPRPEPAHPERGAARSRPAPAPAETAPAGASEAPEDRAAEEPADDEDPSPPSGGPAPFDDLPGDYDSLPDGFWEDAEAGPYPGSLEGPDAAREPVSASPLAQLQALFPGRVLEFKPATPAAGNAVPEAQEADLQGYDEDGQDPLGFGADAPDDR